MSSQDQRDRTAKDVFDTSRDASGRWLSTASALETEQSKPEPTTTLAKTKRPGARPEAPVIASATTPVPGAAVEPGPGAAVESGPRAAVQPVVDEPVEPSLGESWTRTHEEEHPFFRNDVPKSRKERELFESDDDDAEAEQQADSVGDSDVRRNLIEWVVVLVAAVLLALVLRAFLVQAFYIPSRSMVSTLEVNDRVLVNKLSYEIGDFERGDIVVFHRTDEEIAASPGAPVDVIKRVIGLPGETVEIVDNTVLVDGEAIDESYLDPGVINYDYGPIVVDENKLFVMGDNRTDSDDSRGSLGQIDMDRVVGRAFVLFWPLNRLDTL